MAQSSLKRIALALAFHCGWDGQFKANAMAMSAREKLLSGSNTKQASPTIIEYEPKKLAQFLKRSIGMPRY